MPPLADVQSSIAAGLVTGDTRLAPRSLVGGDDPAARFAIHIRNYRSSLSQALHEKFPATAWLLGGRLIAEAAAAYVREHPPLAPCIAEYASTFPAFVAGMNRVTAMPYVESFARLEWALGRAAIAVTEPALGWHEFAGIETDRLLAADVTIQAGVDYVRASHPVDTLMRLFLSGQEPDSFVLPRAETRIEVRGSRGGIALSRLDAGTFAFRAGLAAGRPIGDAAGDALDADPAFDAGSALRSLVDHELVVSMSIGGRPLDVE